MEVFQNRKEAGKRLAQALKSYKGKDAVVYSLPRGGTVLGTEVADELTLPHDILIVRKIGHPTNPEYAIGAVNDTGDFILNDRETEVVDKKYLEAELRKERAEAGRRASLYRGEKRPLSATGKIAIIVDDGIATGLTMRLAIRTIKKEGAKKVIVATPVAPPEAVEELKKEAAEEILVLTHPEEFRGAVGAHYREFEQVDDQEVVNLLNA